MLFYISILYVVIIAIIFLFENDYTQPYITNYNFYKRFLFLLIGTILIILSGFRIEGIDRDFFNYVDIYNYNDIVPLINIESSFLIISKFVKFFFNDVRFLFIIYAILGVSLKCYSIKKYSQFWFLSFLIYISYSFTLHEMTQIRSGVAIGFILLTIKPIYERKFFRFILLQLLATFFHYSAILFFPMWFINKNNLNKVVFLSLIPIAYLFHYVSKIEYSLLTQLIQFPHIQNKILAYHNDNSSYLNVFNVWQLLRILISIILILKADKILSYNRFGIIFIKMYVFSTIIFVSLANNPSFATRACDLFAIGDIVTIPFLMYLFKPKVIAKIIIITIGFSLLFLNLFYNKILI